MSNASFFIRYPHGTREIGKLMTREQIATCTRKWGNVARDCVSSIDTSGGNVRQTAGRFGPRFGDVISVKALA